MKRKLLITLLISTCLLSACGKETKVEEPKEQSSIIETTKVEEIINNPKEDEVVEELKEITKEIIEVENTNINEILTIGQSFETMEDIGVFYLYDDKNNEYAIICDESDIKYFMEFSNEIKIKPILKDAGDRLFEIKKDGYIMTSLILYHQEDLLEIMKKYGYNEEFETNLNNLSEEDYDKIKNELIESLSEEELLAIENSVKNIIGNTKSYYLESLEVFDNNDNSLNIYSLEELKEYYNNMILKELNKYKELLEIEEMEELIITNDDILISNLEEEKVYYYDKRTNIINNSGKVLKVKIINLESNEEGKNEEGKIERVNIQENFYTQVTSSSILTFGKFGNESFYLWPTESKIELFTFEFIEDEDEINTLLKEDSLFEGFAISTIKEKEIITFEGDATTNLFNDLDKTIEIIGKDNLNQEEFKYQVESNEVIELWTDDLENVYWTYKE